MNEVSPAVRTPLHFDGRIPPSKSLLNRAQIIAHFAPVSTPSPALQASLDESQAQDVVVLHESLARLGRGESQLECGEAGTALRFLAFAASRLKGRFEIHGARSLIVDRPQAPLIELLRGLGVRAWVEHSGAAKLILESRGWTIPSAPLAVPRGQSSQFASGVLLSAWNLPAPLNIALGPELLSQGYLELTLAQLRAAGMQIQSTAPTRLQVAAGQVPAVTAEAIEPDVSSAFAVAAVAVASRGSARLHGISRHSLQPDIVFAEILERMGARVSWQSDALMVSAGDELRAVEADLGAAPDLFPVLAALASLAPGRSRLFGAPQLQYKESGRVARTADLLRLCGVDCSPRADGMEIRGSAPRATSSPALEFDPRPDHRLAMAAAVRVAAGERLNILHPEVVNKSFPQFWSRIAP